jgi:hypothetical protein
MYMTNIIGFDNFFFYAWLVKLVPNILGPVIYVDIFVWEISIIFLHGPITGKIPKRTNILIDVVHLILNYPMIAFVCFFLPFQMPDRNRIEVWSCVQFLIDKK